MKISTIFLLLISIKSFGQTQINDTTSKIINLNEVVVSVNKDEEKKKTIAQQVRIISSKEIELLQAQTTADILANSGSAFVQKSQQGGGSPVLRGFEANKVLLEIDGVRMNNLIYRGGHLQNIITVDNFMLEHIEVLHGPSSTIYGSDALGGVVHLYTKNPVFSDVPGKIKFNVNAFSRYGSVNNESNSGVDFNIANEKYASMTAVSISRFDDLESGKSKNPLYDSLWGKRLHYVERINNSDSLVVNDDPYLQKFSGYTQYNFLEKIIYKKSENFQFVANIQFSSSTDIPRYDRLTDPDGAGLRYSEWNYGPQERLLMSADANIKNDSSFFQSSHINLNYQKVKESRHTRRFGNDNRENRIEDVSVWGASYNLTRSTQKEIIRIGIEGQYNSLSSTANKENITTGSLGKLSTRYPDGTNTMGNIDAYWSHTRFLNNRFTFVDGVRLGYSSLYSTFEDTTFYDFPFDNVEQDNFVISANVGIIHHPSENTKYSLLLSSGYRVPNIDDLAKVFESSPGTIIVPNADLKPEQTLNIELGVSTAVLKKCFWENAIYYTKYLDAIVTSPYTFNGADSIVYDDSLSRVMANQNQREAFIYGFTSSLTCNFTNKITSTIGVNYTYGRIKTDSVDSPLDHIPPFMLNFKTQYSSGPFNAGIYLHYNAWKNIDDYYLNGEDNEQYATPDGMPAWMTFDIKAGYRFKKYVSVNAGVDNILDSQYRTFSSGINAPGRNIYVGIKFGFAN